MSLLCHGANVRRSSGSSPKPQKHSVCNRVSMIEAPRAKERRTHVNGNAARSANAGSAITRQDRRSVDDVRAVARWCRVCWRTGALMATVSGQAGMLFAGGVGRGLARGRVSRRRHPGRPLFPAPSRQTLHLPHAQTQTISGLALLQALFSTTPVINAARSASLAVIVPSSPKSRLRATAKRRHSMSKGDISKLHEGDIKVFALTGRGGLKQRHRLCSTLERTAWVVD